MSSSMMGIVQPRETDVLCARGGAALRHAGNQDYQRLIQENKQLYSTCLKNEKQNISRSIVAAIIGKNGRFLGRDAKKEGVWFDIGHKKAVEKTSQALRDCKLEEQDAEFCQMPVSQANGLLDCVPIYNASGLSGSNHSINGSAHSKRTNSAMSFSSIGSLGSTSFAEVSYTEMFFPQWQQQEQQEMGRNATGQLRNNMAPMPAPPLRKQSLESIPSWTASVPTMEPVAMPMPITEVPRMISSRPNLPRQYNTNSSCGSSNSNSINSTRQSITSNSSRNNNNLSNFDNCNGVALWGQPLIQQQQQQLLLQQQQQQQLQQSQQAKFGRTCDYTQGGFNGNNCDNLEDQRPSVPSLNLVEPKPIQRITSSMSSIDLDFSNYSPEQKDLMDCKGYESPGSMMSCLSKLSIGYESRRSSLMSGLSKLSGYSSDINNTFSNMANKFNAINYALSSQPESLEMEESGIDDQQSFAASFLNSHIPEQQDF